MSSQIQKDDLLKYIIMEFDNTNDTTHAYIVRLALQYVKKTFHFEKLVYIQQSLFDDGSIIC